MPPHSCVCLGMRVSCQMFVYIVSSTGQCISQKAVLHQAVHRPHPSLLSRLAQDSESELSLSVHGQSFNSQKPSPVFQGLGKEENNNYIFEFGDGKSGWPSQCGKIRSFFLSILFNRFWFCYLFSKILHDPWSETGGERLSDRKEAVNLQIYYNPL